MRVTDRRKYTITPNDLLTISGCEGSAFGTSGLPPEPDIAAATSARPEM